MSCSKDDVETFGIGMLAYNMTSLINKSAISHLIIIKQPEHFPESSTSPHSMNTCKLTLNESAIYEE